jgi:hypothetical protein
MSDYDPWKEPTQPSQPDWQAPQPAWTPPAPGDPSAWGVPPPQTTNGLAIASLVCGILVFVCGITWIPALVLGYMARGQIRQSGGTKGGKELAIIGIVLGYVGLAFSVLFVLFFILALVLAVPPMQMLR